MSDARLATITLAGILGGAVALVVGAAIDSAGVQVLGFVAVTVAIVANAFWRHGAGYVRTTLLVIALAITVGAVVSTVLR